MALTKQVSSSKVIEPRIRGSSRRNVAIIPAIVSPAVLPARRDISVIAWPGVRLKFWPVQRVLGAVIGLRRVGHL